MNDNDQRVAIVTGAGTGIGAATARLLAAKGLAVVLVGRRPDLLEENAARIASAGGRGHVQWIVCRPVWDSGRGGEHVDASGRDLRRGDPTLVCERGPGRQPGPDGKPGDLLEPVADWGKQHLRVVLPGDHR